MKPGTLRKANPYGRMPIPSILSRITPDLRPHLEVALMSPLLCVWQPEYRSDRIDALRIDPIPTYEPDIQKRETEKALFVWMNAAKYMVMRLVGELPKRYPPVGQLRKIAAWQRDAAEVRDVLLVTNQALIRTVMKRHLIPQADYDCVRQQATIALCSAVDRFNGAAGFKFSTYAYKAVQRSIQRQMGRESLRPDTAYGGESDILDSVQPLNDGGTVDVDGRVDLDSVLHNGGAGLSDRERTVICRRFGIGHRPQTFRELAGEIGVCRERVRQIETKALKKLRMSFM